MMIIHIVPMHRPKWKRSKRNDGATVHSGAFELDRDDGSLAIDAYIVERNGSAAEVFLRQLPPQMRLHPHGRCWQYLRSSGWFKLHWETPAFCFLDAHAYVEQMLMEM